MTRHLETTPRYTILDTEGNPLSESEQDSHTRKMYRYEEKKLEKLNKFIDEHAVEKDAAFIETETEVRAFFEKNGFSDLAPIFLVEDDEEDVLKVQDRPGIIAFYAYGNDVVFVRDARIKEIEGCDPTLVTTAIAHELSHATVEPKGLQYKATYIPEENNYDIDYESGFTTRETGSFFEEGFAVYAATRYTRAQAGDDHPIGIQSPPQREVPGYILVPDPKMTAGPDGYTMELIGYYAQESGTLSREAYQNLLFDTRRMNTQEFALNAFAKLVNQIKPGLHAQLNELQYGKDAWREGMHMTYDAVVDALDLN